MKRDRGRERKKKGGPNFSNILSVRGGKQILGLCLDFNIIRCWLDYYWFLLQLVLNFARPIHVLTYTTRSIIFFGQATMIFLDGQKTTVWKGTIFQKISNFSLKYDRDETWLRTLNNDVHPSSSLTGVEWFHCLFFFLLVLGKL